MLRRLWKPLWLFVAFATGAGGRFFWQPKEEAPVAEALVSRGATEPPAATRPPGQRAKASQRPMAAAPGAVSAELWAALQNRPANADWARLIESAHNAEKEVLFAAWIEADPAAAIRWHLRESGDPELYWRDRTGGGAVERAFARDPERAWRIVSETGSVRGCEMLLRQSDALAAHPDVLKSMLSSRAMPWLAGAVARQMGRDQSSAAVGLLASSHPELLATMYWQSGDRKLFKNWTEADPKAAEHVLADATPTQKMRFDAMQRELAIERDPASAAAVLGSLSSSAARARLAVLAAQRLTGADPSAAFALLEKEAATPTSAVPLSLLLQLAQSDPTRARALAEAAGLRPDDVSGPRTGKSPAEAQIAEKWAKAMNEPARLGALLAGEAAGVAKSTAFHHTASRWVVDDPEAASQWVGSLPQGPDRDAAVAGMSLSLAGVPPQRAQNLDYVAAWSDPRHRGRPGAVDFDSALAWSATISDPATRLSSTLEVMRRLMDTDAGRAMQALELPTLPPDTRAAVSAELGISR